MNISYNWLKQYIATDLTAQEVADKLTSIGLEVDSISEYQSVKGGLKGLVIGEVKTCIDHPDSDHLHITTVDVGTGELLTIVCGAPNVAAGQKVIVATIGTVLYDGDKEFVIKKSKIRGQESFGMICAEDEIGVGTSHDGIIVLPPSVKVGTPAAEYYNIEDDTIIEVDITPNRIDAASHIGVARDIALALSIDKPTKYTIPDVSAFKVDNNSRPFSIEIAESEGCCRYAGVTITDIKIAPSPEWLQKRLKSVGLNPINNIVDVSNFILHEFGQPLHTFDADKIDGNKVIVKTMPAGTKFTTLDGVERSLDAKDLMICNANEPMCIAGVFGGLKSGISDSTTSVFIESACFNPTYIRKTARRHDLHTEASFLFERGVDPNNTITALKRAALLIQETAGGQISSEITDIYPVPVKPFEITVRYSQINRLIGESIPKDFVKKVIKGLEAEIVSETDEQLQILMPPYRVDVQREADVIEDILRIYGYNTVKISDNVNSTLSYEPKPAVNKMRNLIANALTGAGYNEIMCNSLTKSAYYAENDAFSDANSVRILNPLSQELNVMRQTLLYGAMETVSFNSNRQNSDLQLFEFGNCYFFNPESKSENPHDAYSETEKLGLLATGFATSESWTAKQKPASFYGVKSATEQIISRLGIDLAKVSQETFSNSIYSDGLRLIYANKPIATIGIVSKKIRKEFDIKADVYFAELEWTVLMKAIRNHKVTFSDISKYPEVRRDLSLLIDKGVTFDAIKKIVQKADKRLIKSVSLFDVYEGDKIADGKKSYAISIIIQDEEKTLNDKQIDRLMEQIMKSLDTEIGAKIR